MAAVGVDVKEVSFLDCDVAGTSYGASSKDARVTDLVVCKLIEEIEIARGIHDVVILIAVLASGADEDFAGVVVDQPILEHESPLFALPGVEIDYAR